MSIGRSSSLVGALANPVGDLLSYHQAVEHVDDGNPTAGAERDPLHGHRDGAAGRHHVRPPAAPPGP